MYLSVSYNKICSVVTSMKFEEKEKETGLSQAKSFTVN
jgi:hypothetical protein